MAESRIRVLLVDDDRDEVLIVRNLLARIPGTAYELEVVPDYPSALAVLARGGHDVALVDYRLGGRDGLELIREAKGRGCTIPAILLTGWAERAIDVAASEAGAVGFLSKDEVDAGALERSLRFAIQRGRAEVALRDSDRSARAVLDSLAAHIAVVDESGRILTVNQSWREFAGSNGAAVASVCEGADYLAICEGAGGEGVEFAAGIRSVLSGSRDAFTMEYACHSPGRRRWFMGRVTPLRGEQSPCAVVSHVDITDRLMAEEALRRSEARYRLLADNATDLISRHSPAGDFLYASPACSSLLGYTPEELATRSWGDLVHPDDRAAVHAANAARMQSPDPGRVTFRARRKEGGLVWLEMTSRTILEAGTGAVLELLCTSRDVSERVRVEEDVRTLNGQLGRRLQRIDALRRIDEAITSSRDLRHTLGIVADQASRQLGVDVASVQLFGRSGEEPVCGSCDDRGPQGGRDGAGPVSSRLSVRVATDGNPLHVADLAEVVSRLPEAARLVAEGFVAYHALPLMAEGTLLGVLELIHRGPLDPDAEWLDFADALAVQATIAINNASLLEGLRSAHTQLASAYEATIEGWARVLDLRDKETEGHSRRVTELTERAARAMGLGEAELVHIRRGALLHDIGKMGIPDGILLKPGPLSEAEREVMNRHPGLAVEMLWPVEFLRPALDIPYCHHERWDGKGYPRGLQGEEIPLPARIFAAVDIWDALTHDRPYRKAWPRQTVLEHIRSLAGNHLDPRVVDVFLSVLGDAPSAPSPRDDEPAPSLLSLDRPAARECVSPPPTLLPAFQPEGRRPLPVPLPRVLVAHDRDPFVGRLLEILEDTGHDVVLATDGHRAWRLFSEGPFRLVVVDGNLPGLGAPELCRRIRGLFDRPYTYLVMAAEQAAAHDRVAVLASGADDFLIKPYDGREVPARLEVARRILGVQDDLFSRAVESERVQDELRRQNERLAEMVVKDPLTGLYNRRHLIETMEAQLAMASRRGDPLSAAKLGIDQLQRFSDEFGPPAGDEVVRVVAHVLKANVRAHDMICRYGGDEFVILLPGASVSASNALAERIQAALAECAWPLRRVTASIGVATRSGAPWDGALLLDEADRALGRSRRMGPNRVTHHDHDPARTRDESDPALATPTPWAAGAP